METIVDSTRPALEAAGVVPTALLRPLLSPPRNDAPKDPPAWAYFCPHCTKAHVWHYDPRAFPVVGQCQSPCPNCAASAEPHCPHARPVILVMGEALFVGRRFLRGMPKTASPALVALLGRIAKDDIINGRPTDGW